MVLQVASARHYTNVRFAYAVDVPKSYAAGREADNGDGRRFASRDGRAEIAVWGSYTVTTLKEAVTEAKAEIKAKGKGKGKGKGGVTYAVQRPGFFALSWREGDRIVYRKVVPLVEDGTGTLEIRYPASLAKAMDPVVTRVSRSFRALTR